MQKYLRAIGFREYNTKKKLNGLKKKVKAEYSRREYCPINEEETLISYEKDFGDIMGLAVTEILDKNGYCETDAVFPYVRGLNYLYHENPEFEKLTHSQEYACICDDNNLGIPLIFHVNNIIDYLKKRNGTAKDPFNCAILSGLSFSGMVILPIEKDETQIKKERKGNEIRNHMIDEAKAGNMKAIEQLTLEDMDTYTLVSNRSKREDIFTIVTSYFMPYSVECDKYSVLGNIVDVAKKKNSFTDEVVYYISLECNSIQIEFTIAESDILGVPEVGRRFKGYLWLQGEVDYL